MKLTKTERDQVRLRCRGHCAYCGNPLAAKWHADHMVALKREGRWIMGKFVMTGEVSRPDADHIDNLWPACVPCNVDKSDSSLNAWRKRLERSAEILRTNYSTYRHALRFGLITEQPPKITFYFERATKPRVRINPTSAPR